MQNALIYFGNDLEPEVFDNDNRRNERLERGIRAISDVEGLQILRQLPMFCAVSVQGPESVIERVRDLVAKTCFGRVTITDPARPMFRAAR